MASMNVTEPVILERSPDRPRGGKFGRSVRVRLPVEFEELLPLARRLLGVSLSGLMRASLETTLARMVTASVEILRDPNAPAPQRLRLMRFLRECQRAALMRQGPKRLAEALRRARAAEGGCIVPIAQKDKRLIAAVERMADPEGEPEVAVPV